MGKAVKKTISLPPDLASEAEEIARGEGMTLSTVIQDDLRLARAKRLRDELEELQGLWSRRAQERGILTSLRDYEARRSRLPARAGVQGFARSVARR